MFDRIQILFERLVGVPESFRVPPAFSPPHRLPALSARPACWRRAKRVGGSGRSTILMPARIDHDG